MGWGYLMSSRTVTFSEGETVYTVLQRECANAGIVLNTRSGYVVGIGGLNEFDGGKKSGWMYEVNGWSPNYGSTAYYLSKGDNIIWRYTLDLGSDLG
jgi:hypothetical protein